MDSFANYSGFQATLQRLREGLQKTIQMFRFYSDESEREDSNDESIKSANKPRSKLVTRKGPSQIPFNTKGDYHIGFEKEEEEEEIEDELSALCLECDWDATSEEFDSGSSTSMSSKSAVPEICKSISTFSFRASTDNLGNVITSKEFAQRGPKRRYSGDYDSHSELAQSNLDYNKQPILEHTSDTTVNQDPKMTDRCCSSNKCKEVCECGNAARPIKQPFVGNDSGDNDTNSELSQASSNYPQQPIVGSRTSNINTSHHPKLKEGEFKASPSSCKKAYLHTEQSKTKPYNLEQSPRESFTSVSVKKITDPPSEPKEPPKKQRRGNHHACNDCNLRCTRCLPNRDWLEDGSLNDLDDPSVYNFEYVLVHCEKQSKQNRQFRYFLLTLKMKGIQMKTDFDENGLAFVKLHIPLGKLLNNAHEQRIPLSYTRSQYDNKSTWFVICFGLSQGPDSHKATDITSAERIMFLHQIIDSNYFDTEAYAYGVDEMKAQGVITTAYPLHDGKLQAGSELLEKEVSDRQTLNTSWAQLRKLLRPQPLQLISKYFGPEVTFYFSWMGALAVVSIPPLSLLALLAFLSLFSPSEVRVPSVCYGQFDYMCPYCVSYHYCGFSKLSDSCSFSKVNAAFDNNCTMLTTEVSIFLIVIFGFAWKRLHDELKRVLNWNYSDMNNISLRPSFLRQLRKNHIKVIEEEEIPSLPLLSRIIRRVISVVIMVILIVIMVVLMLLLGLLRIELKRKLSITYAEYVVIPRDLVTYGFAKACIYTSIIAGFFNIVFSKVFSFVAALLTKMEAIETQKQYDNSYITKLFILECFNNYGFALYLAFIRNQFEMPPIDTRRWTSLYGIFCDVCDPSGCTADLAIYIGIVLTIKILYGWIWKYALISFLYKSKKTKLNPRADQWEADYGLIEINDYNEYIVSLFMDAVIKYGFMIFFLGAFSLAPLLILIDSLVTIRIVAVAFCQMLRRPVPSQRNLETWTTIILLVTICGVVINSCVLYIGTDATKRKLFDLTKNYLAHTVSELEVRRYKIYDSNQLCLYRGLFYTNLTFNKDHLKLTSTPFFNILHTLSYALLLAIICYFLMREYYTQELLDETEIDDEGDV